MALKFQDYPGAYLPQADYSAMQKASEKIGEDIGAGIKQYAHLRQTEGKGIRGPLGEAFRKYREQTFDPAKGEVPMDYKKWKKSGEEGAGLEVRDKMFRDKKYGSAAYAKWRSTGSPSTISKPGAFTNWMKGKGGKKFKKEWRGEKKAGKRFEGKSWVPGARKAYEALLPSGTTASNVGFKDWLKTDRGKNYKFMEKRMDKPWMEDAFAQYMDGPGNPTPDGFREWVKSKDGRKFRRQQRWDAFSEGKFIGDAMQFGKKGLQTILPFGETGYLEHGFKTPYGGLLNKIFRPDRHSVRRAIGEGRFGGAGVGASGPTVTTQKEKEQAFVDWYLKVRESKQSAGAAGRALYENLPDFQKKFFDTYGGSGGSPIEEVLSKQGLW